MRPLIGVSTSEVRVQESARPMPEGDPPQREMVLGMVYAAAVQRAGGIPVVLPPIPPPDVPALLNRLQGICLSGGPDLDPAAYGADERHGELGPTEPSLDAFELSLVKLALMRRMPILAICRGSQALNVACGGTLHQHVPGHRQTEMATEATHEVEIRAHSRLHRMVRTRTLGVNSFHHQAVDQVGDGLRVVARASDGTIEGIEGDGFVVGVQWHAETMVAHMPLFEALVTAASRTELRVAA
jgi:putative glutamine amidotransferase